MREMSILDGCQLPTSELRSTGLQLSTTADQ